MGEMRVFIKNDTWDMVTYHKGKKLVECKWVFTLKYKTDRIVERYKTCLVVKGFTNPVGLTT